MKSRTKTSTSNADVVRAVVGKPAATNHQLDFDMAFRPPSSGGRVVRFVNEAGQDTTTAGGNQFASIIPQNILEAHVSLSTALPPEHSREAGAFSTNFRPIQYGIRGVHCDAARTGFRQDNKLSNHRSTIQALNSPKLAGTSIDRRSFDFMPRPATHLRARTSGNRYAFQSSGVTPNETPWNGDMGPDESRLYRQSTNRAESLLLTKENRFVASS